MATIAFTVRCVIATLVAAVVLAVAAPAVPAHRSPNPAVAAGQEMVVGLGNVGRAILDHTVGTR